MHMILRSYCRRIGGRDMKNVGKYVLSQLEKKQISQEEAVTFLKEIQDSEIKSDEVAIIGMACKLPNAETTDEFWDNISNGRNCFGPKPEDKCLLDEAYKNPYYAEFVEREQVTQHDKNLENYIGAFMKNIDKFDAAFFGIPPKEASIMDPQHRLFLEVAWNAIEDAGYSVDNIRNTNTGCFVGRDGTNDIHYKFITEPDTIKVTGTWDGILASRLNYLFNLQGPAMLIDTACSSGLVATHEAYNSLRNDECDMAIAGGVAMLPSIVETNTALEKNGKVFVDEEGAATIKSVDNRIHSFDNNASGTVFGEGVVAFLLKPLKKAVKDKDHIYGIIKGSAVNCDGASNGIAAPNPAAQEKVIVDAWKRAKISPESISYIETHGTGTLLGDPVEILGITNAFGRYTDKKQFCGIGSVKTNIGHLIGASGCANVLKVLLSMQHHKIPASLYFKEPNSHINFVDSPVYVVDQLTEWDGNGKPLYAGISSFGFSGTNCHMIIEEAPRETERYNGEGKNHLLTLSAKSETAMLHMVQNYDKFLQDREDINLNDLCYTASIGRGHYEYRVAILFKTLAELKSKITKLIECGLQSIADEFIYYGRSHVVSDKRQFKAEGEIFENELRQYTIQGSKLLEKLTKDEELVNTQTLREFVELYVKGARVDWKKIYNGKDCMKMSLPTYPYDKTHYWAETKKTIVPNSNVLEENNKKHPLVKKCLVDSMTQSIYQVYFNLSKQWVLQEHKIMGNNLVSGTTLVEVCTEALRQYFDSDRIQIDSLVFLTPLIVKLEEDDVETHIIITKEKKKVTFEVVSKHYNNEDKIIWTSNCKGTASVHDAADEQLPNFDSILSMENIEEVHVDDQEVDDSAPTNFGPRWHCIKRLLKIKEGENDVIYSEIELPEQFLDDLRVGYRYHPGMLDDAINIGLQLYTGNEMFLPFSYKDMRVFRDLPKHFYSKLVKSSDKKSSEIIGGNFTFADMDGNLLTTIEECCLKKVTNFTDYISDSFFKVNWYQQEKRDSKIEIPTGNVMIFEDVCGLSKKLAEKIDIPSNTIYYVSFGTEFKKIDDTHYEISGREEEDYISLLDSIGETQFSTVYHLSTVNFECRDAEHNEYKQLLNIGLYSLFYIVRCFLKKITGSCKFILVSDNANYVTGAEAYIKPANASFLALSKTTVGEFTRYSFNCIDIDNNTNTDVVLNEVIRENVDTFRIAYRDGVRYTEEVGAYSIPDEEERNIEIKKDGVYVISGGTGGIGLEMARYIGSLGRCNICLLGYRPIPERSLWDSILERAEDRRVCNIIKALGELEELGCTVIVKCGTINDYDNMKSVFDEMKKEFGKINGVIHSAGVPGIGFLYNKKLDTFTSVISPKVYGVVNLDALTRDQELDFFIMNSSVQSILGGPGQGDYTAANAFLDSYAYYLRKHNVRAFSINWPGWSETGMLIDLNLVGFVSVFKSITSKLGINALEMILKHDLINVVPTEMEYDYLSRFKDGETIFPIKLSKKIRNNIFRYQNKNSDIEIIEETHEISVEELQIIGKSQSEFTQTERDVALIYACVFNLKEIDIFESFGALGGDSIIATSVLKLLNKKYSEILNISDMFTYGTIEEMARYIDLKLEEMRNEQ